MGGIFSKFFKKASVPTSVEEHNLNEQYNLMKHIRLEIAEKYSDQAQFKLIEKSIYENLADEDDTRYRMTISYELASDDDQYPLEDILDKFFLYVSDFYESEHLDPNLFKRELAGDLNDLIESQIIIGKQVYNQDFLDENKKVRVRMVIQ